LGMQYRNTEGICAYSALDIRGIRQSLPRHRQPGDFVSLLFELSARTQYGVMLDLRSDDMPAPPFLRFGDAADCEVIRLGSTADENDLGRFGVDQFRHVLSRIVDQ